MFKRGRAPPPARALVAGADLSTIVHQYSACLRIFGDDLDPADVSDRLRAHSTHQWKKDQLWCCKGVGALRTTGAWILHASTSPEPNLDRLIHKLIDATSGDINIWRHITTKYYCDIFCGIFPLRQEGPSFICTDIMSLLELRGIMLIADS